MQILHAFLCGLLGPVLLGWAFGIVANHKINPLWAAPMFLLVVLPALLFGGWIAVRFK